MIFDAENDHGPDTQLKKITARATCTRVNVEEVRASHPECCRCDVAFAAELTGETSMELQWAASLTTALAPARPQDARPQAPVP